MKQPWHKPDRHWWLWCVVFVALLALGAWFWP
jgi:hypothetical protein